MLELGVLRVNVGAKYPPPNTGIRDPNNLISKVNNVLLNELREGDSETREGARDLEKRVVVAIK